MCMSYVCLLNVYVECVRAGDSTRVYVGACLKFTHLKTCKGAHTCTPYMGGYGYLSMNMRVRACVCVSPSHTHAHARIFFSLLYRVYHPVSYSPYFSLALSFALKTERTRARQIGGGGEKEMKIQSDMHGLGCTLIEHAHSALDLASRTARKTARHTCAV